MEERNGLPVNEITVQSEMKNIEEVTQFINEHLDAMNCPARIRIQIDIAVDEIFGNIVRYAYAPGTEDRPVTVRFSKGENPEDAVITFIDEGRPFDPMTSKTPDIKLPAKKRRIGGLGLYMVKNTMDQVIYSYRDGRNVLTIYKNLRYKKPELGKAINNRISRALRKRENREDQAK